MPIISEKTCIFIAEIKKKKGGKESLSFIWWIFFMDAKVTRHTSTNLEEINEKIAKLLKDPAEAIDNVSIDVDSMSLTELKAFAERGRSWKEKEKT